MAYDELHELCSRQCDSFGDRCNMYWFAAVLAELVLVRA